MGRKEKNLEKMIAVCGLNCAECLAFQATQENSVEKRKQVAEQWSKEYKTEFKPEDINCNGCLSTNGPLLSYCSICTIRQCGREKELKNCAYCNDYLSCQKLGDFFQAAPKAKTNLNEIRRTG